MRTLIALVFMFAGSAMAADSGSFQLSDARDLVRICSGGPDDMHYANAIGFCHGILTGAVRYYQSVVPTAKRFVCAPDPMPTRTKVMNDFVTWAGSHSGYMQDPPIDTLFRYLEEAYPCKT